MEERMMKLIQLRNQEREIQMKNEAINMAILENKELPVSNNRKIQITDDNTSIQENDEEIKKKLTDKLTQTTDVKTANEIISKLNSEQIRVLYSNFGELMRLLPDSLSLVELKQIIKKLLNDKMSDANILNALNENKIAIEKINNKDEDDDDDDSMYNYASKAGKKNNDNETDLPDTIDIFYSNLNDVYKYKDTHTTIPTVTAQIIVKIDNDKLMGEKINKPATIQQINKLVGYFQDILNSDENNQNENNQNESKLNTYEAIEPKTKSYVNVLRTKINNMLNTLQTEVENDYWKLHTLHIKGTEPNVITPEPIIGKSSPLINGTGRNNKGHYIQKKVTLPNGKEVWQKIFVANGLPKESTEKTPKKTPIKSDTKQKFAIDLDKLNNNILSVIYLKSKNAKIKPQLISDNVKTVVMDIIENKFINDNFQLLNSAERRLIECFTNCLGLDIKIKSDETKELLKNFEIYKGQFLAGNNNEKVITALKNSILELLNLKMIPHSQAYNLLFRLNN